MVEESEDEGLRRESPPVQPLNPMAPIGSRRVEDIEMEVAKTTLFLGRCFLCSFWFHLCFLPMFCLLKFLVLHFSR